MISTIAALALLTSSNSQVQGQPAAQPAGQLPSAAALISEMMAKYAAAPTLTGTVQTIIQSGNSAVKVASFIQYDRAKRQLYVRQTKETGKRESAIIVSDGTRFLYSNPLEVEFRARDPYLIETTTRREATLTSTGPKVSEVPMTLGEIYIAGSLGLVDRCVPIDLAVARLEDLQFFRSQLINFNNQGLQTFNGVEAYRISGQWKKFGEAQVAQGDYDLFVSPNRDLVGYRTIEQFALPGGVVKVISSWLCDFKIGGTPDPKLFTVRRP
jgi:hypothetical protein